MKICTLKSVVLLFVMGALTLFSTTQLSAQCTTAAIDLPDNGFPVDGNTANAYCVQLTYDPAILGCATGINMDLAHDYQGDLSLVVNACGNTLNVMQRPGTTECGADDGGLFGAGFGLADDIGTPPNIALVNVDFDDANTADPENGIAGTGGAYGVTSTDDCGIQTAGINTFADLCAACPPGDVTMQICITDHAGMDAGSAANISLNTPTAAVCGCTDPAATNYDPTANIDSGACEFAPMCTVTADFSAPASACSGGAINWTAGPTCSGIDGPATQDGGIVVDLFVYAPAGAAGEAPAGYETTIDVSSPTHTAGGGFPESIDVKDPNLLVQGFDFLCGAPPTAAGFINETCAPFTVTYFLAVFNWSLDTDGDLNSEYEPTCEVLRYDVVINPAPFTLTEIPGGCGAAASVEVTAADGTVCETITGNVPAIPACTPVAGTTTNSEPLTGTYTQADPQGAGCYGPLAYNVAADCASEACVCDLTGVTLTIGDEGCPGSLDGSITIDAVGGMAPFQYSIDGGATFQSSNVFSALMNGSYNVVVEEVNNFTCTVADVAVVGGGVDVTPPVCATQDITVELDILGAVTITAADIDNGSSDECGIASLSITPTSFDCSNLGDNVVILTVTDVNGNVSTCNSTIVTVEDVIAPDVVCANLTIELDAAGQAAITAADIDNGSSDECGIASITATPTAFDCTNVGANDVTLTVTDVDGNVENCIAVVTIEDNILPTITCQDDIVINLAAGACDAEVIFADPVASDNCDFTVVQTAGPTSGETLGYGDYTVSYEVTDNGGNTGSCSFNITIIEFAGVAGNIVCNDHLNISVDENCSFLVTADIILEGGPYGCYDDYIIDVQEGTHPNTTTIPTSPLITSAYYGQTLIVSITDPDTDDTCWGTITLEDKMAPILDCPEITVSCTLADDLTPEEIGFPSVDENCGDYELEYEDDIDEPGCANDDSFIIITRTWTATDTWGNSSTCEQTILVERPDLSTIVFPPNRDNVDANALNCSNANTNPSSTGYPQLDGNNIDGETCQIGMTYTDQEVDICPGSYKILREWVLIDWCTNEVIRHNQIIKVLDTTAPTLSCPDDFTVSTGYYSCDASLTLPLPELNDNCSTPSIVSVTSTDGTVSQSGGNYTVTGLPLGTHTIEVTASDECGNERSCSYDITVEDQVEPLAICDEHTDVSVGSEGYGRVFAETFDDGSYDNCGSVYFKVRRMVTGACENYNGDDDDALAGYQEYFDDYADFCCADIDPSPHMIIFRVYDVDPGEGPVADSRHEEGGDLYGRYNDCMVEATVEDKLAPTMTCPPDITISCHFEFDADDLAATFGTVVTNPADQGDVITVDPDGLGTTNWGLDGLAYDNCDLTITENSNSNVDECGAGLITRVFTATDPSGLTASCVQRIRVQNFDPFDESDINWPQEEVERDCAQGIDADSVPGPTVDLDNCDNVFIGHEDLYLPIDDPYCFKIVRTWVIVDWCQYVPNSNNGNGRWEFNQVIKVTDNEAPVFTSCESPDPGCSYAEDCGPGYIELTAEAEDNCSGDNMTYYYEIDAFNDGTADIQGSGNDASGDYPMGEHSITFYATDGCGNTSECTYLFEIVDCKLPTPVCQVISTSVMPSTGEIEIWASDFEAGSSFDNCDDYEDLRFRIRKVGQFDAPNNNVPSANSTSVTFGCDELGTQWVDLWVGDLSNNWDHCRTYVVVQDPNGVCGGAEMARIAGTVTNEGDEEVEDVNVEIAGANGFTPFVTGIDGNYDFTNVPMHNNYTVTPEKDINHLNGVTTYDLVLMSKHILGVQALGSPYKMIAADVNKSGSITALDMVELRKLILHINTDFPSNTSWRFVDKNFVFANPANPFATTFPEVISINDLSQDELEANFVGVKIGDVNDTAIPNSILGINERTTVGQLVFNAADKQLKAGEEYTIEFTSEDAILGYQFTLAFGKNLEFVNASNTENVGLSLLDRGVITTSWNNTTATKSTFSLTFRALADVTLSEALTVNSSYTTAEAYNADADVLDVALAFNGQVAAAQFELYQNAPNPFKQSTVVSFNLVEAGSATLSIIDMSGKVLKQYNGDFAKGYNELTIQKEDLPSAGILYYQLDTANDTATKKMLLIK